MKAREAALKALSLDENLAEAHTALGRVLLFYDYDFAGADESIDGQSNSIPTTRPPNPRPLNQSQYAVAVAQAQVGEKEKAITALNRSYENREIAFALANVDPRFDALRDEVRFKDLLRRIGHAP